MNRRFFKLLLAALLCLGAVGCAAETRSPLQQAEAAVDYAQTHFDARMEAQGAAYTVTGTAYAQSAQDNTLYQILIDYRDGDGTSRTYSCVLRLEGEAVVLLGEGEADAMTALLAEEAG